MGNKENYLMKENRQFGLLRKDIDSLISILRTNTKVDKIILFGSRAKGNFDPGSDIDIAIKGQLLKLDDILESKVRIENLSLPYKIDLIIYESINEPDLISHIDRVGVSLFER
jgi:predicted nucleotidyltransferase